MVLSQHQELVAVQSGIALVFLGGNGCEPCDFLKTQELFISRYQRYEKEPGEDLHSILHGIKQFKGHIHLVATEAITEEELRHCDRFDRNRKFQQLAQIIDRRIYENYRLWPTNYIAHDLLNQSYRYRSHYTEEQRQQFMDYMDEGLKNLIGEEAELRDIFLHIYACRDAINRIPTISCKDVLWYVSTM